MARAGSILAATRPVAAFCTLPCRGGKARLIDEAQPGQAQRNGQVDCYKAAPNIGPTLPSSLPADKLALRDLPEMFTVRDMALSHEAVRDWEAKLTPILAEEFRHRRRGKVGRGWYVDETYLKVNGRWCYTQPTRSY